VYPVARAYLLLACGSPSIEAARFWRADVLINDVLLAFWL